MQAHILLKTTNLSEVQSNGTGEIRKAMKLIYYRFWSTGRGQAEHLESKF
jgi:hypothetical protein